MKVDPINAVTFDVGGTLIEPWPSVGHVYAQGAAELGEGEFEPDELNSRFAEVWKTKGSFDYTRAGWFELVRRTFDGLVAPPRLPGLFDALYDRFRRPSAWRIHSDVLPTLRALRARGVKLGIISNWDERLGPLLEDLQLVCWFDVVVVSHEIGAAKPDPALFALAADRLQSSRHGIVHVGDSEPEDRIGARAAGLRSILLDRSGAGNSLDRVSALTDLIDVLAAMQ